MTVLGTHSHPKYDPRIQKQGRRRIVQMLLRYTGSLLLLMDQTFQILGQSKQRPGCKCQTQGQIGKMKLLEKLNVSFFIAVAEIHPRTLPANQATSQQSLAYSYS